jgi:threonyl-tRNA synthetase
MSGWTFSATWACSSPIKRGSDKERIDHARNFPRWLAPGQVRVESDLGPDPIKAKIAEAEKARVHTMLVIGGRDVDAGNVSVRLHSKGPQGAKPKTVA